MGIQARMKEILNEEGIQRQGESSGGILLSKDDAFAQVMGPEHSGWVCGVGFGRTPSRRSERNLSQYTLNTPSSNETSQRVTES